MNVDSGDLLAEMGERDRGDYVDPITAVSGAWGSTELLYPCNIQKKAQFCIVNREKMPRGGAKLLHVVIQGICKMFGAEIPSCYFDFSQQPIWEQRFKAPHRLHSSGQ